MCYSRYLNLGYIKAASFAVTYHFQSSNLIQINVERGIYCIAPRADHSFLITLGSSDLKKVLPGFIYLFLVHDHIKPFYALSVSTFISFVFLFRRLDHLLDPTYTSRIPFKRVQVFCLLSLRTTLSLPVDLTNGCLLPLPPSRCTPTPVKNERDFKTAVISPYFFANKFTYEFSDFPLKETYGKSRLRHCPFAISILPQTDVNNDNVDQYPTFQN